MSTQPLGIRVICDAKRSASCRDYIETGALQIYNARIIARHEGWDTTPEVPRRDICPACMRGKQLLDQDVALVAMFERTDRIRCDIDNLVKAVTDAIQSTRAAHARESEKVWKVEEIMNDIEGSDPTTWERLRAALDTMGADQ